MQWYIKAAHVYGKIGTPAGVEHHANIQTLLVEADTAEEARAIVLQDSAFEIVLSVRRVIPNKYGISELE